MRFQGGEYLLVGNMIPSLQIFMNETHCTPDPQPYQMVAFGSSRCGWHTDLNKRYDFKRPSCVDGFTSHWVNKICVRLRYGEHISAVCLLSAGVKSGPTYCRELLKCMNYQSGYLHISSWTNNAFIYIL
jgi:hypothetical protein